MVPCTTVNIVYCSIVKLLHEEIALLWLVSKNSKAQEDAMSVAWFFFGVMVTNNTIYVTIVYSRSHDPTD